MKDGNLTGGQKAIGCLMIFLIIIFSILLMAKTFIMHKAKERMPDDNKDYIEKIQSEPLAFTNQIKTPPLSEDSIDKMSLDFYTACLSCKLSDMSSSLTLSEYDYKNKNMSKEKYILRAIDECEPVLNKFKAFVDKPDYKLDNFSMTTAVEEHRTLPIPNFLSIQNTLKLLSYQSKKLCADGKFKEAAQNGVYIIRASKSQPYTYLITNLIAIAALNNGIKSLYDTMSKCNDPETLHYILQKINEHAPKEPFLPSGVDLGIVDAIGTIRTAQRYGINSDYQGMTGSQIYAERMRVEGEYLRQIVLPKITNTTVKAEMEATIENYEMSSAMLGGKANKLKPLGMKFIGIFIRPMFLSSMMPNSKEARIRDFSAVMKTEALRLEVAKKLFSLESADFASSNTITKSDSMATSDSAINQYNDDSDIFGRIVPKYISEIPRDLFDIKKGTLKYNDVFYSIGPDEKDDHAEIIYDPTNGTVSSGDIFFVKYKNTDEQNENIAYRVLF